MVTFNAKIVVPSALVGAALLFSQPACAKDAATARARAEVKQVMAKAQALLDRQASAEEFVDAAYADDVVMMGGSPGAKKGKAAVLAEVKKWFDYMGPNGVKGCKYSFEGPAVVSATTFSSFFNIRCAANPPYVKEASAYSELYIWKKTPKGWRISLEMWLEGAF